MLEVAYDCSFFVIFEEICLTIYKKRNLLKNSKQMDALSLADIFPQELVTKNIL